MSTIKTTKSTKRLLCTLLAALLLGILDSGSAETVDTTAAEPTLSAGKLKSIGDIIASAKADAKAEDTRTLRDMLTAAYFADDLAAVEAIKKQTKRRAHRQILIMTPLTLEDVAALVEIMKTEVSMAKPTGFLPASSLPPGVCSTG